MKILLVFGLIWFSLCACGSREESKSSLKGLDNIRQEITLENPKNLLSNHPIVYGEWNCSGKEIGIESVFKLVFIGKKVIVTDFTGMSQNTSYEKIDGKILLETGDVLSIKNDSTIIFPMPITQFFTTINCICTKI